MNGILHQRTKVLPLATALATVLSLHGLATAQPGFDPCGPDGMQSSGAIYRLCVPPPGLWNGDLVIFAHGFIPAIEPLAIPEDQFVIEDTSLPELAGLLGYAFGVTSFSTNGFAVPQGLADVVDLVDVFTMQYGPPGRTYLIGSSQGGLITALALEAYPDVFDGGVSVCGAVGDFGDELNYVGDFHVLFDFFFPGVVPGDPTGIPQEVLDNWETVYVPRVRMAIWSNIPQTVRLLRVARAPVDLLDLNNLLASIDQTVVNLLWYNVFATNDAMSKLGGLAYDNSSRWYRGSGFDWWLNRRIPRYTADPDALASLAAGYITSGDLGAPVVTAHTLLDEVIPYAQELRYLIKNLRHGDYELNTHLPIPRYGHCNFTLDELLGAFAILVEKTTGQPPVGWQPVRARVEETRRVFRATPPLPPLQPEVRVLQEDVDLAELASALSEPLSVDEASRTGSRD